MKLQWYIYFIGGIVVGLFVASLFSSKKESAKQETVKQEVQKKKNEVESKDVLKEPDLSLCPTEYVRFFGPLEPPKYHEDLPEKLETNYVGEVKVTWQEVPDAARYHLVLFDENGKEVRVVKTTRTVLFLKELPFDRNREYTPFSIALRTESQKGIAGELGERRELMAQRLVNLSAPKVKEITIED